MNKLGPLLDEYELSHQHPFNIAVHWVAEPFAIFGLMALAASIPLPVGTLLWPFLILMLAYFSWLSITVALAFLPVVIMFVLLIEILNGVLHIQTWQWALPLFITCWFMLLFGHKVEGRVPSVFQNPNLIFVGPAWLMRITFRRLNFPDP
jgi:uncharacterized membrane protein YGL010W